MRLQPNEQFAGYTVMRPLGRGGMAFVYLAEESDQTRRVALKLLPEDVLGDAQSEARFLQEARTVMALEHPNIVPLYRHGIERGAPWMALRFVEGGDLADRLSRPLAVAEGLQLFRQIAKALDFAHQRGVVHRDLKPQNVLLSEDGHVYLADFGIAKLLSGASGVRTGTGGILGTPQYMAPEYARGDAPGPAADIYALGVMAFQWLTGALPFDADTPQAVLFKQALEPLPNEPLQALSASVGFVLRQVLDKSPAQRHATAGEFVDALAIALSIRQVATTDSGPDPASMTRRAMADDHGRVEARQHRAAPGRQGIYLGLAAAVAVSGLLFALKGADHQQPGVNAESETSAEPAPSGAPVRPAAPHHASAPPIRSAAPAPLETLKPQASPQPAATTFVPPSPREPESDVAVRAAMPVRPETVQAAPAANLPPRPDGSSEDRAKQASSPPTEENRVDVSYRRTRPPRYPPDALRRGVQGTVMVLVLVGSDGRVLEAKVRSSVDTLLDEAALKAVQDWQFSPATVNGVPYDEWALVPVRFSLDGQQDP